MKSRRSLSVILFAIFLDLVAYGILVPVVPQLLANPESPYYLLPTWIPIENGYILLGFLIATFPIIQFFSAPILGELSDIYGRKKILALALFGTFASFVVFAYGIVIQSLALLFVSRVIGGIVGGNISVAQAAIADITTPKERTKHFGLIGAAYGLGFIIGPVIGAVLSDTNIISWFNAATPFWFASILSFLNTCLIIFFLKDTRQKKANVSISWLLSIKHIVSAYGMKDLRPIFATNFFFQAGITFFATFFTVFLVSKFHMQTAGVGYYIAYAGVWIIISQGVILPLLSDLVDDVRLLRYSLLFGSLAIFAYYIPNTVIGLGVVGALFALTNGISMATLPALASRRASPDEQGEILGINTSVQALAQAIPPILSGFLAAKIAPSAPVYISGAVIAIGWVVFMMTVRGMVK